MISRRHFLSTSLGALSVSTLPAIEPIKRPGKSRMQLGVAAYSFREYFQWMRDKEQKPKGDRKAVIMAESMLKVSLPAPPFNVSIPRPPSKESVPRLPIKLSSPSPP